MKTNPQQKPSFDYLAKLVGLIILTMSFVGPSAFAASQTWTNAPVDNTWTNINNWVAKAVPGAINSSTVADVATFTNPIPLSGFGGAGNPITNDFNRSVRGLVFDTVSCGAYVFGSSLNDNFLIINNTGNIQVGPAVVNPITFNQGLRTAVPSSTNYRYDITNNAVNVNATLYFAAITNTTASTRPCNLALDGSNTGTNTIARIDDLTGGAGAILLDKNDAGTWVLSGPNDLPQKVSAGNTAHVFINQGTLQVKDAGSLGAITVANLVVTNGTLQIDGVTLNNNGITLRNNGVIRMNGSGTVNGVTIGNQAITSTTLATTSSSDVMTVGNAANQPTGGAADTVLHISGPGTVLQSQSANYVGKWSVDAGKLQLSGGLGSGANLNIAAGATFDVTPFGAGSYNLTMAAISAAGTGTTIGTTAATILADAGGTVDLATGTKPISLIFTPTSFAGDTTHPSIYVSQGTLMLGGNAFTVNNAGGTALGVGTYRLIQQASGNITSGGGYSVTVTGSGKAAGTVATISVSGGNLNLVISAYVAQNLVWTGDGSGNLWDTATSPNWLNGASHVLFNTSDNVTFNSVGSTNPTVSLLGTLSPGTVTVNTSANNYNFTGSGIIAGGTTALTKINAGTLNIGTVNTYGGGTVVSNGVLQLGIDNAIPGSGAGDVQVTSPGTLDMNAHSDTIGALNGTGTVDDFAGGGTDTLTVGNNNNSGTFSGLIKNTSGSVGLNKAGNGVQTLASANTYSGNTTINAGTLKVTDPNALGSGASTVNVNAGTLDLATNVIVGVVGGSGGVIANNTTTTTNSLIVTNGGTVNAVIADGSGAGKVSVLAKGGTLVLNSANTYSGGTIVASGAAFLAGFTGQLGTGGIIASNNTRVGFSNANNPSGSVANNLTTVDNASITVSGGGNQANNLAFQFYGGATATNIMMQACSVGGASSFSNFFGTVIVSNTANLRWFTTLNGGDNATFDFEGGSMFSRDNSSIRLGALQGGTPSTGIFGPSVSFPATYTVGGKGLSTIYSGVFSGSNSLVKIGAGSLQLDGAVLTTNTDSATYTNYLYTGGTVTYLNNTTISNGSVAIVVPNALNNSPNITLAGSGAVLDASKMGYITNFTDPINFQANSALVTNGVFELLATTQNGTPQALFGIGSITGTLYADAGSTVSPGQPTGALTVSGNVTLDGATFTTAVNRTNSPSCGQLAAAGASTITVNGGTLNITNVGPNLVTGDAFHIFNKARIGSGFATLNLPVSNALNTVQYVWTNKLVIDGTLVVLQGATAVNTNAFTLTNTVSGNVLTLSWPVDHTGYSLQAQTNALSTGLGTNWVAIPGTASVNTTNLTINPANGSVFYRLVYP